MIVSQRQAEEAWELLARSIGTRDLTPLHEITEALVSSRYRYCTLFTHPDREGGSLEKFTPVDRAKHMLLAWLARAPEGAPTTLGGDECPDCSGTGILKVQRGFTAPLRRQCGKCKGTGDLSYEHDKAGD